MPLPAVLPLALVASITSVFAPPIVTGEVAVATKVRLLMSKSAPSVVVKFAS